MESFASWSDSFVEAFTVIDAIPGETCIVSDITKVTQSFVILCMLFLHLAAPVQPLRFGRPFKQQCVFLSRKHYYLSTAPTNFIAEILIAHKKNFKSIIDVYIIASWLIPTTPPVLVSDVW